MKNNNKFIIIAGPTAVGKTSVSVELAQRIGGEIVSADSMQIYRYMDIGTAKISEIEKKSIPHHMIDIVDPDIFFTVSDYSKLAREKMDLIFSKGKIPIVVGGTGLYINALLYEMDFNQSEPNSDFREKMEAIRLEKGNEFLYHMLIEKDASFAKSLHYNNYKRVIRALEILEQKTNVHTFGEMKQPTQKPNCNIYILSLDRKILYNRIDERVCKMIQEGLIEEVLRLIRKGYSLDNPSMKGIGYRQMIRHLQEEISLQEAIRLIQRDSRRYAKRQITWFKRYEEAIWIDTLHQNKETIARQIINDLYH